MRKFCIFCGKYPASKTMEHPIPQWPIKYTGDPNRKVNLGVNWINKEIMEFSFNDLIFPACASCNRKFAKLELQAKNII
jgi:hypothetical protein